MADIKLLEAIAKGTAKPIRALMARVAALEARLDGGDQAAKTIADAYVGVWKWSDQHSRGAIVTDKGSLWLCVTSTGTRPGESGDWRLISKNGKPPERAKA